MKVAGLCYVLIQHNHEMDLGCRAVLGETGTLLPTSYSSAAKKVLEIEVSQARELTG